MKAKLQALAAALFAALPLSAAPGAGDFHSAKIIETISPVFPQSLIASHRSGGTARVAIEIDRTGRLADWLVVGYTNRQFATAAVEALREWTFEPARWDGEPVAVCLSLSFEFEVKGVVISLLAVDTVEAMIPGFAPKEIYAPRTLRDLDHAPRAVQTVPPAYPTELSAYGAPGEVMVRFYIDEQGKVRLPHALGRPPPVLAGLAIEAMQQWRFAPPTSRGKPVLVQAQQLFRFAPVVAQNTVN